MTTLGHAMGTEAHGTPTTFVLEGQGVFRTVTGAVHRDEAVVALHEDNPLLGTLARGDRVRLIHADGRAWDAHTHPESHDDSPLAPAVKQRALAVHHAAAPRIFRLSLGSAVAAERGHSPRT